MLPKYKNLEYSRTPPITRVSGFPVAYNHHWCPPWGISTLTTSASWVTSTDRAFHQPVVTRLTRPWLRANLYHIPVLISYGLLFLEP